MGRGLLRPHLLDGAQHVVGVGAAGLVGGGTGVKKGSSQRRAAVAARWIASRSRAASATPSRRAASRSDARPSSSAKTVVRFMAMTYVDHDIRLGSSTVVHHDGVDAVDPRTPPGVVCRRAGIEDDLALAALAHDHYGGDPERWCSQLRRSVDRRDGCVFLAEHDGAVVGYGKAAPCEPRGAEDAAPAGLYLTGVVVAPAWRRRGVGTALTAARLAWARGRAEQVWAFTNARNTASLVLHERLGFVEAGRAASYLGEPFDGGVGVLLRAEVTGALRFEPVRLPGDAAALTDFLTRQPWPFHVGTSLTASGVRSRIAAGGFDGATVRSFWIVDDAGADGPHGRVGLVRLEDLGDGDPLFDLRVDERHRGRGVATAAVRWLTRWLFTELPAAGRVEANARVDNTAMRAVLERCGYVKEAHHRRAWPGADGAVHDGIGYAVLRQDWEGGSITPVRWEG